MLEAGDRMGLLLMPSSSTGAAGSKHSPSSAALLQSGKSTMLTKCMLMEVTRNYNQKHHLSIALGSFDYLLLLLKGSEYGNLGPFMSQLCQPCNQLHIACNSMDQVFNDGIY